MSKPHMSNWIRVLGQWDPGIATFLKLLKWLSYALRLRTTALAKVGDFLYLLHTPWLSCLQALHTTWHGKEPTPVSEILPPDWISARETFLQRWSHWSVSVRNTRETLSCQLAIHEVIDNTQNTDWVTKSMNGKNSLFPRSPFLDFKTLRPWSSNKWPRRPKISKDVIKIFD